MHGDRSGGGFIVSGGINGTGTVGSGATAMTTLSVDGRVAFVARFDAQGALDALTVPFYSDGEIDALAAELRVDRVPVLAASPPPTSVADTYDWLRAVMVQSLARLDPEAPGEPEGVVVRTPDRRKIAKIRFEDYARTMKERAKSSTR